MEDLLSAYKLADGKIQRVLTRSSQDITNNVKVRAIHRDAAFRARFNPTTMSSHICTCCKSPRHRIYMSSRFSARNCILACHLFGFTPGGYSCHWRSRFWEGSCLVVAQLSRSAKRKGTKGNNECPAMATSDIMVITALGCCRGVASKALLDAFFMIDSHRDLN